MRSSSKRLFAFWLLVTIAILLGGTQRIVQGEPPQPTRAPLVRVVDLNVGQSQRIELCDGKVARVKLLDLQETRDSVNNSVRAARVKVEVNERQVTLTSATYHLPTTIAGVQIDCPITKGYLQNSRGDAWGLVKDARLRLWPAGSPLIATGTFAYPVKQRWFASDTQMANEPVFVDGGERPFSRQIYYHYGLDFGGPEGMVEVLAATDGLVVSSGTDVLPGYEDTPARPRYDVVYTLDGRGWYYRYSHMQSIAPAIRPGRRVKMGQKIGVLGKEGGSGGWSHLHFDIQARQPSGKWGTQAAYAFAWETYCRQYTPRLVAVARPHHLAWVGEKVTLNGTRSWSERGRIVRYDWAFTDGAKASGAKVERSYTRPGAYSEVLKVTDDQGRIDYDFAVVQIVDKEHPDQLPPTIHACYYPTFGIKPGQEVTFKVRIFRTTDGQEVWDFGDGSPKVTVRSEGGGGSHNPRGYAVTAHRYKRPGDYIARVERADRHGFRAIAHLHVRVGENEPVPIMFDTDIGPDNDDAGAAAILHALADKGEATILAMMCCVSSEWGAPCLDAINTYYGRPNILIGTLKESNFLTRSKYSEHIARNFPNDLKSGKNAPDATDLYRELLAAQPDHSVTIAAVGPLKNLENLLKSDPDAHSGLNGRDLIARKIKILYVMGPYFNSEGAYQAAWNFRQAPAAASYVVSHWPTPIKFGEGNLGHRHFIGARLRETPVSNPVRKAYELASGPGKDRHCADPSTVVYAVRDTQHFNEVSTGCCDVRQSDGFTRWASTPDKGHFYNRRKLPISELEEIVENLLIQPPRGKD